MKIGGVAACALVGACMVGGGAVAEDYGDQSFAMPREIVSAAAAFEDYMKDAAQVGGFANGDAVHRGLKAASSYEPSQLEEGMIAYGAIAALQDDNFIQGVERAAGRGNDARQAFAERLIEDPFAATHVDGAAGAAHRIETALSTEAAPLLTAGGQVKTSAYSVQHQAWSKVFVADAQGRLAEVKTLSASRAQPSDQEVQALAAHLALIDSQGAADDAPAGYSAIEARALALAAEAVLGHARGADRERLSPLLTETSSAQCLRMAKLNLYQCMAVAGPQYEDIYCMGQHALYDTGQCVSQAVHGGGVRTMASTWSPRPSQGGYQPMVAHHSLRIDP